jgi:hypothetical protein
VGAVHEREAEPVEPDAAATTIENAGRDTLELPSFTDMTMPLYVPTAVLEGVPVSVPCAVSNEAQEGLFLMLNVSVAPLAPEALGVKLYIEPVATEAPG